MVPQITTSNRVLKRPLFLSPLPSPNLTVNPLPSPAGTSPCCLPRNRDKLPRHAVPASLQNRYSDRSWGGGAERGTRLVFPVPYHPPARPYGAFFVLRPNHPPIQPNGWIFNFQAHHPPLKCISFVVVGNTYGGPRNICVL